MKTCGPRTYVVRTGHRNRYVHTDHMIKAHDDVPDDISEIDIDVDISNDVRGNMENVVSTGNEVTPLPVLRRSQRVRKPPVRLDL